MRDTDPYSNVANYSNPLHAALYIQRSQIFDEAITRIKPKVRVASTMCLSFIEVADIAKRFSRLDDSYEVFHLEEYSVILISNDAIATLTCTRRGNYRIVDLDIIASNEATGSEFQAVIESHFDDIRILGTNASIDWYFKTDTLNWIGINEMLDDVIYPEAYPWLPDLKEWAESFINGHEQVLILYGKPGTGKTRLIRYLLQQVARVRRRETVRVMYTVDEGALHCDNLYINFLNGTYDTLVLEDLDQYLGARTKTNNHVMNKLLTGSDGLVSNKDKKIIVTTNLSSINDIDPAFIRPGRCFAQIQFRDLTVVEANMFLKAANCDASVTKDSPLSQLYRLVNGRTNVEEIPRRGIGFL